MIDEKIFKQGVRGNLSEEEIYSLPSEYDKHKAFFLCQTMDKQSKQK